MDPDVDHFLIDVDASRCQGRAFRDRVGGVAVTWCGYISNADQLRIEAVARGATISAADHSALLAWAYQTWGDRLPVHVDGQYAIAILDRRANTVFLAHDVLGLTPLYYAWNSDRLVAGTKLSGLVELLGNAEVDEMFIAEYLATGTRPPYRTPYRGITQLEAGCVAIWTPDSQVQRRIWDLNDVRPLRFRDVDEYGQQLRERVFQAVGATLTGVGHAVCELSGGLDSSTVFSVAARCRDSRLSAISYFYPHHPQTNESRWIEAVLEQAPAPWLTLDSERCRPFAVLPSGFWGEPQPAMINWGLHEERDRLLRTHGADALVTGQGGDWVLFGIGSEPLFLADLWRRHAPWRAWGELRRWHLQDPQRRSLLFWCVQYVLRPLIRHLARQPLVRRRALKASWLTPEMSRLAVSVGSRACDGAPRSATVGEQYFREGLSSMCQTLASFRQMPLQIEFRHPLLDRKLVEFVYSIPWSQKMAPGQDRGLQRKALVGILPDLVRRRHSKVILDRPFFDGFRDSDAWRDVLTNRPRLVEWGIVDDGKWRQAVARASVGWTESLPELTAAFTIEVWLRQLETMRPKRSEEWRHSDTAAGLLAGWRRNTAAPFSSGFGGASTNA